MDFEQKKTLVHSYTDWWHSIDFGGGLVSEGEKPVSIENELQAWDITEDYFKGKSVLDIGAADGGFSFFAERAGASKVVAFDQKSEARPLGSTRGFEIAKEVLGWDPQKELLHYIKSLKNGNKFHNTKQEQFKIS